MKAGISRGFWLASLVGVSALAQAAPKELTSGSRPIEVWKGAGYRFTPEVEKSVLAYFREQALAEISAAGKTLPADFLAWVDGDPVVRTTVYGARREAANVLLMLRSLEIDLGKDVVRKEYTQLALAMAVVHADKGPGADLKQRDLVKIVIPGDPRVPVDTKDSKRKLDRNDHIINFLNSQTIEEEVVVGQKEEPPPLRYDDKGVAIPPPKNAKPVKVPIKEKRTRTLYAADVLASRELQLKFNAYMKEHGEAVEIDCGDGVVKWNSKEAVRAERKAIDAAFVMFRTAYEEKGLLPKARDASPSPAESMAWWIRNDRYRFPDAVAQERKWPRYPLNAPWPTLTLLAADNQPLREREERWTAFRDKGEMRTYGEYIGPIAQQFDMQSARRLSPYPFYYGTYQMMAKDGGVCGTMANMGVRTYNTLGIPSCTAGQPGHCALILFQYDPAKGLYECKGGQFATGGPDKTSPHTPWVFGDVDARKPMVYYQTIGWAVNYGLQSYLDSTVAYQMFRLLPSSEKTSHGADLLNEALVLNPYNFLIPDTVAASMESPAKQLAFLETFQATVKGVNRPGCPQDALYLSSVKERILAGVAKLPVPSDQAESRRVFAKLLEQDCQNAEVMVKYEVALEGMEATVHRTDSRFEAYLKSARDEQSSKYMAGVLEQVAGKIPAKDLKKRWLEEKLSRMQGQENFLAAKNQIFTDACVTYLSKALKKPMDAKALNQPLLDGLVASLKTAVAGQRDPKSCKEFSDRIAAVAKQLKDADQSKAWLQSLDAVVRDREEYTAPGGKKQKDPCVATIRKLIEASSTAKG